jgi:hypothetical protein
MMAPTILEQGGNSQEDFEPLDIFATLLTLQSQSVDADDKTRGDKKGPLSSPREQAPILPRPQSPQRSGPH